MGNYHIGKSRERQNKNHFASFLGVTLAGTLFSVSLLSFYIFIPQRQRVVTGLVRKQKNDGTYEIVKNGNCFVPDESGNPTELTAQIQSNGKFTIGHNNDYVPSNQGVPVKCLSSGESQVAIAYLWNATEPGISGFEVRYANIIYPATSIVNQPPQILIQAATLDNDNNPLPEESDPLKQFGKTQTGSKIGMFVRIVPSTAVITSQQLIINGNSQNLEFQCQTTQQVKSCSSLIPTPTVGRYSVVIKARSNLNDPLTESIAAFNFIVLENPNVRPPISGVNPAVISVTPTDGANQIDVGTSIHIEFSEPVINLKSQTIYLAEDDSVGEIVNGRILSGGIPITPTDARSVIDFIPNNRLKSGKKYKVVVTTDVIDTNIGEPNAVPPIAADPDAQRYLDQDTSTNGLQEFTSKFKTFEGSVITPTPINAQGYKIGILDDLVVTTYPVFNGPASSGTLQIYDSTEFIGAEDAQNLQPIDSLYIPHVPLGLAVKKETYTVNGVNKELNLIAVTTLSIDIERPRNVWFYNIDENRELHLVGVVTLVANGNSGQVPNSISIERKRAYIGSSSNGGIFVVDIQQAIDEFSGADNTPDDGNEYNNNAVLKAILPSTQLGGGGFAISALMQKAPYMNGNDYFLVDNVSAITQLLTPFAYVASSKQKLIGFNFDVRNDGRLGYISGGQNGKDGRVTVDETPLPVSSFYDVEAVSGLQLQGQTRDIAVGVASSLWIFDVSNPTDPLQYPKKQSPTDQQQPAKSFAELGVPIEVGTTGKQVEIEETLVYVMFDNGIGVFDINNPDNPYLTTVIRGLPGLRRFAVKDGFIYSLGSNGLNVSIGRGVAQVITYGYDPTAPDEVCGNPVVISKNENKMVQPAGIFFQLFGQDVPREAKVVIRKVEVSNSNPTEIATVNVSRENLRTITNPETGFTIVTGNTFWQNTNLIIDTNASYTAEVVIDENFRSKQVEIPFSHLLPDNLFQKDIKTNKIVTSTDPQGFENKEDVGSLTYLVAGNAVDADFKINGEGYQLYDSFPSTRQPKSTSRAFGSNIDYIIPSNLGLGLYPFTFKAKLKANPGYSEEVSGTLLIGNVNTDVRKPGSTVVGNVEVNSGSLALSENDISIKGRGLSLELTRSYNSQAADRFGTIGYGWTHSYQISLTHFPGGYQMIGGEGSGQTFLESKLQNGVIKAEAPYLGRLVKNADGSLDYFTKSQTKYHFRQPVEQGNPNVYLGNLLYIEEPNKNRITLAYDIFGRVSSVADSSNRKLNFEYEAAENVFTGVNVGDVIQGVRGCPKISQFRQITKRLEQSVTGKAWRIKQVTGTNIGGLTIDYLYDDKGNLISVNRNGTDAAYSEPTASREWKYSYNPTSDANGNNGEVKYEHLLKTVKSPNNGDDSFTEYKYFLTATAPARVQQILMPEGISNSFLYTYDPTTNLVNSAMFTDGKGNITNYELDSGRVNTITAPLGAITQYEWTLFGQIKKTTDPEGKVTEIVFDENNNPATQTVRGADGYSIQTISIFDTKFSKMSSFKDGNGNLTSYEINQTTGNIDEIALPNGRKVIFRYFPNGDLKTVTDQYGTVTGFSNYDSYGNPQNITKNLGGGQQQVITQTFDSRSRQRSKSDNLGTNSTIVYDALDRMVSQTTSDPAGYRNSLTVETIYLPEGQPFLIIQKDDNLEINRTSNIFDKLQRLKRTVETVSGYNSQITRNFTYDNNSNLLTEQNRRGITTEKSYNALNHLTKTIKGGKTVWEATVIDKVGNPKTVSDLYGNQTIYVYDGLQRLTEKRLPENATEKLAYDANNNITDSFDHNDNKTHYEYDSLNRVDTITDALDRKIKWTYTDVEHKVTKETVNRGLTETTVLDGLERPLSQTVRFGGNTYQNTYEYSGRNVLMTDPRGTRTMQKHSGFGETGETEVTSANPAYKMTVYYTALGGVRQMTDANNRVTNCINDGFNRKRSININGEFSESWNYDGEGLLTSHTDRRGISSIMTYDELGRNLTAVKGEIEVSKITYADSTNSETREGAENASGSRNPVTMKYDGLRRVKEITNADSHKKSFVYDGENLLEETDFFNQGSRKTKYVYDALNRVREVFDRAGGHSIIDYSASDLVKTTTDRRGNITTQNYDALGRLTSADSYGKLVSFTYDGNNNRLTQQDGLNNETAFEYDNLNRLIKITHPNGLQIEQFTYDAVGNLKIHNDGCGGITENLLYNSLDQLKITKDGVGNISEFQYDGAGLLLSKKDPKLNVTTYVYNALGSLTQITEPGLAPWTLSYDDAQNLVAVKDSLNRVTTYEYDTQNRLKKTNQPLGRNTFYEYDNNSNVTKITDPKGQVTEMTYTALDNPDSVYYKDENGAQKLTHQFAYDAEENPWQIRENRNGFALRTYTREYDNRNRLTKTTDGFNRTIKFAYNNSNYLAALTDASNRLTTYSYDAKNQLDTVVQNSSTVADYDWYADGLLQKVTYANAAVRNYNYDNADRVTNINNSYGAGQSESYDYAYDANSNRTNEVRKENGIAKRTSVYDYDAFDRLTKADYTANVETQNPPVGQNAVYVENTNLNSYGYDAVGNRINETSRAQSKTITLTTDTNGQTTRNEETITSPEQVTTATFDALNQLTQLNEPSGISNFTYDLNGNLSQVSKNSTVISNYEYDVRNQLTSAKDGSNNELARFDYDFERKRLSKTNSSGTTNYVYAGNQIINETSGNNFTANYTIGNGEIVKSEFSNGENHFHFTDALGSVTALANTDNSSIKKNEYDAFGLQSSSEQTANSIGYTGQRLDKETGLMALGNGERYYSPDYARFIQQDRVAGITQIPQSLNRFSYAHNNPNKYTDPSGNLIFLIPVLLVALFAIRTETGRLNAEARRLERGLSQSEAGNSAAIGLGEAFGFKSLVDGVTGQDVYTGRDLGKWEARAQIALGTFEIITNAVGAGQLLKGGTTIAQQGVKIFSEAESGLAGIKEVSKATFRGAKTAAANEWASTLDELGNLRPFKETPLGKSFFAAKDRIKGFFGNKNVTPKSGLNNNPIDEFDDTLEYQGAEATRNMSRGEMLRNKYSNLSREDRLARIDDLAEANAGRRLSEMEAGNPGAHFYSRHGADTSIIQQQRRATTGYTPDGYSGVPRDSSRFMSNREQLRVMQRADIEKVVQAKNNPQFSMEGMKGEGYLRGGSLSDYRTTQTFKIIYRNNLPYTGYPVLR